MTNLEKIDCAVLTTLHAHPEYHEVMTDILMKKMTTTDPFITAKFFSRADDARAHMIEVSHLDLLSEVLKNAIKVAYLMEQKGFVVNKLEQYLDGSQDTLLLGSTAAAWLKEQIESDVDLESIFEQHPEILPILLSQFVEVRYEKNKVIEKKELENSFEEILSLLKWIDQHVENFHKFTFLEL